MQQKGKQHYNWKGGFYINKAGYRLILMPKHHKADCKGYVYEHFVVMEKKINRQLISKETIHHIDGNKSNNKPKNLMLFPSIKEHLSFEKAERFKLFEKQGKICSRCNTLKPLDEFLKSKKCCLLCERKRHTAWRRKNTKKLQEYYALKRAINRK